MRLPTKAGDFQDIILPKLSCHLFPARATAGSSFLEINNATFSHWKKTWEEILHLPNGEKLSSDSFLRQDKICSIASEGKVIGMIAASFFPLEQNAVAQHSYLQPFSATPQYADYLARGSEIMSIEYLSVDPSYRKSELGVSLGSVLLGISMELFRLSPASIVLGTARSKIHVDEMCYEFGFSRVGEMNKFGHPCTLIMNTKDTVRRHGDLTVHRAVKSLWSRRQSYIDQTQRESA